jgi:hypothetical protein
MSIFFLLSNVCHAEDGSLLFEKEIDHFGKGMVDYHLPTAIGTKYKPQMVGYWVADFGMKTEGKPFVVLEVIIYGADFQSGRNVNRVILQNHELCLVFFHTDEKQPNKKNLPQYCYVQATGIDPSKKYVKLRHWVSRTPIQHIKS